MVIYIILLPHICPWCQCHPSVSVNDSRPVAQSVAFGLVSSFLSLCACFGICSHVDRQSSRGNKISSAYCTGAILLLFIGCGWQTYAGWSSDFTDLSLASDWM